VDADLLRAVAGLAPTAVAAAVLVAGPQPTTLARNSSTAPPCSAGTPSSTRVHLLTHADLGDSLAAQARADEAVAAWVQALDLIDGMASDRTRKAISAIRPTLAVYRRRGVPGAGELDRRAREALL
jgi:hypothetical protein